MTATTCPTSEQLKALSLGQLSTEESDDLIAHVSSCEACRSDLETVNDVEDSLIASLRDADEMSGFDAEPDCQLAIGQGAGSEHWPTPERWIGQPTRWHQFHSRSANTRLFVRWVAVGWAAYIWPGTRNLAARWRSRFWLTIDSETSDTGIASKPRCRQSVASAIRIS